MGELLKNYANEIVWTESGLNSNGLCGLIAVLVTVVLVRSILALIKSTDHEAEIPKHGREDSGTSIKSDSPFIIACWTSDFRNRLG